MDFENAKRAARMKLLAGTTNLGSVRTGLILVLGILAAACGCAQPGEEFVPVAGRVTVNGKPLTVGSVSFRPDPAHTARYDALHRRYRQLDAMLLPWFREIGEGAW